MPTNKYLRADRRGRPGRYGRNESNGRTAQEDKREQTESFATRNEASGRYPGKEYPSDSYYTVNKVYRQYVSKDGPRR